MKQIVAVYNLKSHVTIETGTSVQDAKSHRVNLDNPAERAMFKLVVRYLIRLARQGFGFFGCTSNGWHWLRYIDTEATK